MTDPRDLRPASPPPGTPRGLGPLLFLVLSWLLPAAVASVLRAALGAPLWVGALVGAVGAASGTLWILWRVKPWPTHGPLALLQAGVLLALGGLTWRMLGIPAMGGLVTVGGGDAGNHAALQFDFATRTPGAYQGFTLFHTVTYGLGELLGLDVFSSFRAAFYLIPGVCAVALVAGLELSTAAVWRSARAMLVAQAALLLATAVVWARLVLRLMHYNQADGFYAHLFGLVPLVLMGFAYALPRSPWVRCATLTAFLVLYRFTYGLNLGDLLITCGALWLLESAAFPTRWRRPVQGLGGVFLVAAGYAYWRLLPLATITGGLVPHAHRSTLWVQGGGVLGLLLLRLLTPRDEAPGRRLLDFTVLFAGTNALIQVFYRWSGLSVEYYMFKYGLHAVVLLLLVAGLVVGQRVGALLLGGRPAPRAFVPPALAVLGLLAVMLGWSLSFSAYSSGFKERVRGTPPFRRIDALEDRGEVALVRQVLGESGKRFGGLLSPSWPRVNFTNVDLGLLPEGDILATNGHYEKLFHEGGVREAPGACVFWEDAPEDDASYQLAGQDSPALLARVRELRGRPDKVCRAFSAAWVPSGSRTLCYRCD